MSLKTCLPHRLFGSRVVQKMDPVQTPMLKLRAQKYNGRSKLQSGLFSELIAAYVLHHCSKSRDSSRVIATIYSRQSKNILEGSAKHPL